MTRRLQGEDVSGDAPVVGQQGALFSFSSPPNPPTGLWPSETGAALGTGGEGRGSYLFGGNDLAWIP